MPRTLKRFRIVLALLFLGLIGTWIALFAINKNSADIFIQNVSAVKNMKRIIVLSTSDKLYALMMLLSSNVPSTYN